MATTATIYRIQLELSDIDRGFYETLVLRVARHPSEDEERMVVRVLARALSHEEGLEFGRGLSNAEDAALWSHAPTGEIETWIDVGVPGAERLHRASKRATRLIVYTHKSDASLLKEWRSRKIHKAESIAVHRLPREFVADIAGQLARTMDWHVTLQDGELSVMVGDQTFTAKTEQISLASLTESQA